MNSLRRSGFRIALDDFGTGYSSLSYLRDYPFDKLKIDRSFVSGVTESGQSLSIIESVVALGRGLGLETVAEGVERSEEHTSELQSIMRISYAVFCLKKKNKTASNIISTTSIHDIVAIQHHNPVIICK